jgi:transcriptional regulator with XRE-family HTH domain
MKNTQSKPGAAPEGRQYTSVAELLSEEGLPKALQERVAEMQRARGVATWLAQLRHRAGITQQQMADELGVSQSTISKLEAGKDDSITLRDIREYARVTGERIGLSVGRRMSHNEGVMVHAEALRYHLNALAEIASQDVGRQGEIKGFLGDAFYNLMQIVVLCNDKLPVEEEDGIEEVKVEILRGKAVVPTRVLRSVSEAAKEPAVG